MPLHALGHEANVVLTIELGLGLTTTVIVLTVKQLEVPAETE